MRRFAFAVPMVVAGVLLAPAAAWAHAELVGSDPGHGDRLPVAPAEVRLTFSGAVDLTGGRVTLQRRDSGRPMALEPRLATLDRKVVSLPLPPDLSEGAHTVMWFFLGKDGHLMGGEIPFSIGEPLVALQATPAAGPLVPPAAVESAAPVLDRPPFTMAVAAPQAVVRIIDYVSLALLIGGGFFLARVWMEGSGERRARRLLWWALLGAAVATLLTFGLTAAGLRGVSALDALDPPVMGAVLGTRFSRVMAARAAFLGLGFVALAVLALGRESAARSCWWQGLAALAAGGVLATHALLGHASNEGFAARLAVFVHLTGVAVWLGGLVFLAAVVIPGRSAEEVRRVLPRYSRLAFAAVTAMVLAGTVMMLRVAPKVTELPQSGYGRMLLLKLALVGLLLIAARQARTFTERRLVEDATRIRPLVMAVGVELVLAVVILSSTSVLAGRQPPSDRPPTTAASAAEEGQG